MNSRNTALIYFRVSTHLQAKKISPDFQRHECLALAQKEGFVIDTSRDIYFDDESAFSGKKSKRDGFQAVTKRWKEDATISAIIIYDLSRLFRDARAYFNYRHELEARGIELISVLEPAVRDSSPAGKLPAGIIALVNEYNSALYGAKIRDNMRFKAESGIYPGKATFGYKNVREEGEGKKRAWIEVNDKEAPWVSRTFDLYAEGTHSFRSLADALHAEGFPTKNGRPVQPSVVEAILTDRIYIGWIEWGSVAHPNGQQERLIDASTFEKVQLIIAAHNKGGNRQRKHHFLVRGFAWCAECGSRIQGGYARGGRYSHYFCAKRQKNKRLKCNQAYVAVDKLEEQFTSLFRHFQLAPAAADELRARIQKDFGNKERIYNETRRGLQVSINNIKEAKKKAFLKFVNEDVDGETYETARAELESQEADLTAKLARLEGNMTHVMKGLEICVELTQDICRAYQKAPYSLKSVLAGAFIERLEVRDGRIVSVTPAAPLDYACFTNLRGNPLFNLAYVGGDKRSLIEQVQSVQERINPLVLEKLENAFRAVQSLKAAA